MSHLPGHVRDVFKTIWEVPQRGVIDHAAARAPFVDQSQSMNLYFGVPNYQKLNSALIYGWQRGLKTGCYYLRTRPAVEAIKVTGFAESKDKNQDDAGCVTCSA
jgi:ribonucleotide reductase alpha subunit